MVELTDYQQHQINLHTQADELFRRAHALLLQGEQLRAAAKCLDRAADSDKLQEYLRAQKLPPEAY